MITGILSDRAFVAIVALIVTGVFMLASRFTLQNGTVASVSHIWDQGGFFPNGLTGFVAGFQIAIFALVGVELVGTAAAETENPEANQPRAINATPIRIMLFYIEALFIIMTVTPWNQIVPDKSPLVAMFSLAGFAAAAHPVNFVVLTSATSSANTGVYPTSRMLFGLANSGQASEALGRLNSRKAPANLRFSPAHFCWRGSYCSMPARASLRPSRC